MKRRTILVDGVVSAEHAVQDRGAVRPGFRLGSCAASLTAIIPIAGCADPGS